VLAANTSKYFVGRPEEPSEELISNLLILTTLHRNPWQSINNEKLNIYQEWEKQSLHAIVFISFACKNCYQ
jgi:hypothetical protein